MESNGYKFSFISFAAAFSLFSVCSMYVCIPLHLFFWVSRLINKLRGDLGLHLLHHHPAHLGPGQHAVLLVLKCLKNLQKCLH